MIIDIAKKRIIKYQYIEKESYHTTQPIFIKLKQRGLSPTSITLDGHRMVIRALLEVWSTVTIQRCLFHIQRQGLMWLRYRPKTLAGQKLKDLLKTLTSIRSENDKNHFIAAYRSWNLTYGRKYSPITKAQRCEHRSKKNNVSNKQRLTQHVSFCQRSKHCCDNKLPRKLLFPTKAPIHKSPRPFRTT